ncbi:hypothetical protein QJS66_13225 [Kocuria rhizophila]|nr:hypothetical protein QJS66_13225 [Kocuria rhizophila]
MNGAQRSPRRSARPSGCATAGLSSPRRGADGGAGTEGVSVNGLALAGASRRTIFNHFPLGQDAAFEHLSELVTAA